MKTVDYHTAGEPFRIVADDLQLPGRTVHDRREALRRAQRDPGAAPETVRAAEDLRQLLCREPRGHADMYGGFITAPDDDGAHFGVLFWHNEGYSTACGHGTIALGAWAVDTGRVPAPATGTTEVRIDVPSGRVAALVTTEDGRVTAVTFRNVPARVVALGVQVGDVTVDLAYGGALYAVLDAATVGLAVEPALLPELIRAGRELKAALVTRPDAADLYGVIFYDSRGPDPAGLYQRNVTVFADGQVDRSPCGSGTSACLALLHASGDLGPDEQLRHGSIVGTDFLGRVLPTSGGVITEITGMAYRTGESTFTLDARDPVGTGFVLR